MVALPDLVLDTHACIFALVAPHRLGRRARAAMRRVEQGRETAWIPAVVLAEVALLRELRRIDIGHADVRDALEEIPSLRFLPLDLPQLDEFVAAGAIREAFDRLIIAAARSVGAKLVTRDARIQESGLVQTVWD
ncbi:MAG: hypothetical protein A2138_13480 [Deltaproteobacteria bacterium RBG_16_71_12]|nr:MAG: hypothetical protein A2138_13480 [Deltaproteobacteria bacterium RBG_16_71_12]